MITIRQPASATDWHEVRALLVDYVQWIRTSAGLDPLEEQPEFAVEIDDPAAWYTGSDRTFLMAFDEDVAVGIGALRRHDAVAELKRMYVRPVARGTGAADALVRHLMATAVEHGCGVVWLETLEGVMDRAIALYRRHGFEISGASGRTLDVPGLVTMERRLSVCAPA